VGSSPTDCGTRTGSGALGHQFGEGVYQFWITPADLRARRFDKVTLTADAY